MTEKKSANARDKNTFTCPHYSLPPIPAEKQEGFCAKRHRKAPSGDYCFDCKTGIQAAKNASGDVRAALPLKYQKTSSAKKREWEIKKSKEEKNMGEAQTADEKVCFDCGKKYKPTSNVQKRCPACKAKKKAPPASVKSKAPRQDKAPKPSAAGATHQCERCRALDILLAAGQVDPAKLDLALKLTA